MRSYTSCMDSLSGTSPLASPAGVAQTPEFAPVGSGQSGAFGSGLVVVKYGGSFGAGAAAAGVAGAAGGAGGGAGAPPFSAPGGLCFPAAKKKPTKEIN